LHHEDLERAVLILYLLILVVKVMKSAWYMITALPRCGDLFKPEMMQFWQY